MLPLIGAIVPQMLKAAQTALPQVANALQGADLLAQLKPQDPTDTTRGGKNTKGDSSKVSY